MNASILQPECQKADSLYSNRQDFQGVSESIRILSGLPDALSDFEVKWRLSRALFFAGQEENAREKKAVFFSAGMVAAEDAAHKEPNRVEGHFWLGVNSGLLAEVISPLSALLSVRKAIRHLKMACAIFPVYHGAGPLRVY